MKEKKNFTISFNWETKKVVDTARVGAMYCFKHCTVNWT